VDTPASLIVPRAAKEKCVTIGVRKQGRRPRVRGGKKLARPVRAGFAWISARIPIGLRDTIARLAASPSERRSVSSMIELLLEEALRARGVEIRQEPDGQADE